MVLNKVGIVIGMRDRGLILLVLLAVCPHTLAQKTIQTSFSSYAFKGDFGLNRETFTLASYASVKYQQDQWSLRLSQPYVYQNGPAKLILIEDGETGNKSLIGSKERKNRQGYADPNISISYSWPKQARNGRWSVAGLLKIPAADKNKGFSNGRQEYSLKIGRSVRVQRWMFQGRFGRHLVEFEQGSDNSARNQISIGGMYFINRRSGLGFSIYEKEATKQQKENVTSLNLDFKMRIGRYWQLGLHGGKGISQSAADMFIGLDISYYWKFSR